MGLIGKRTFVKNRYFLTLISACLYVIWQALLVWGSLNTVQSHVYLLSNLSGVMVIPILICMRKPVHKFEKFAFLAIVIASLLLLLDRMSIRND